MRVLMVVDQPVAHTALANILAARSDVEHFDSANVEALEKLALDSYDVLLLDIDLDLSVAQLVHQVRERNLSLPSIVFATSQVEHAVAAFERHTVDYVLKPFSKESVNEALDRAARRAQGERAAKLIEALPQQLQKQSYPGRSVIAIKAKGRILFINPGEVVAMRAEGNYVRLQRESDSYLMRESISRVAEKLKAYGFIRIHRSWLVNTAFVVEIKPYSTGNLGLRVKGGKEYAVTRPYKKNLKSLTELWMGNGTFFAG